jgi:hypothetical protein
MDAVKSHDTQETAASVLNRKEAELIRCDAGRSVLFHYLKQSNEAETCLPPSGESSCQQDLSYSEQQEQLAIVLTLTLSDNKNLKYYQGLHDIAGVLLYNLQNEYDASAIMSRLCRVHLRDALREDLNTLTSFLTAVFMPLLGSVDKELHDFIHQSGLEASIAILPWIITWFTHDIHDALVASRLVDAFISSHPLLPL